MYETNIMGSRDPRKDTTVGSLGFLLTLYVGLRAEDTENSDKPTGTKKKKGPPKPAV